jgi:hypothetical protein
MGSNIGSTVGGALPRSRTPPAGEPIVSTVGRAGELLGVDPARLAVAVKVAQLRPWGRHASGEPVYPWGRLCAVAAELGATIPDRYGQHWRHYAAAADRGRANRQRKQPRPGRAGAV